MFSSLPPIGFCSKDRVLFDKCIFGIEACKKFLQMVINVMSLDCLLTGFCENSGNDVTVKDSGSLICSLAVSGIRHEHVRGLFPCPVWTTLVIHH